MSLDFYLEDDSIQECSICSEKIENPEWWHCPWCGNSISNYVHSQNITHNLNKLWKALDCYDELYNSEGKKAIEVLPKLEKAYKEVSENEENYQEYNSPNGWGMVEHATPWLKELILAIQSNPDATIKISK